MEQKCTLNDLIDILNKVIKIFGYGRIKHLTLDSFDNYEITYDKG